MAKDWTTSVGEAGSFAGEASVEYAAEAHLHATLMSHLPCMVYRCANDENWSMYYTNDACERLTGYPKDALLSKRVNYSDLIHPDDREYVWAQVQECLGARRPFNFEYRIHDAGGKEKWVWEQGQGYFSPDGVLNCLEGYIFDITERKLSELKIREDEKRLKLIFNSSSNAMALFKVAPGGALVFEAANKAYRELFGRLRPGGACDFDGQERSEALLSLGVPQSWIEYETPYFLQAISQSIDVGYELESDIPEYPLFLEVKVCPVKDEAGSCTRLLWNAKELTEARLREAELLLKDKIVNNMFSGTAMVSMSDGKVIFANPRFEAMFGYQAEELLGRSVSQLTAGEPAEASATVSKIMSEVFQDGFWMGEIKGRKKDGSEFWTRASIVAYEDPRHGMVALAAR